MLSYVEEVLAERSEANNAAGRQLLELVNSVPNLSAETFADAFASSVKDLLMVLMFYGPTNVVSYPELTQLNQFRNLEVH